MVARPGSGKVYKNINIWVGNYGWASEKNIKDMTISFTVPLDWITSNNIDKGSIVLYRYNDDSWEQLPTSWTSKNENSITFTSSTPGFSPFAISGEPVSIPPVISTDDRTHVDVATNDSNMTSSSQTNESEPGPANKAGKIMLWGLLNNCPGGQIDHLPEERLNPAWKKQYETAARAIVILPIV